MKTVVTIGLDIAKSVLQVHGINAAGEVVIRRRLSRGSALAFFEKLPRCRAASWASRPATPRTTGRAS